MRPQASCSAGDRHGTSIITAYLGWGMGGGVPPIKAIQDHGSLKPSESES